MAYPTGDHGSPPYPASSYDAFPDPRKYQSPSVSSPYQPDGPPRRFESSAPPNEQPIANAVNAAFDKSTTANTLPDQMIQQITEQVRTQVINSLKAEGLAAPAPPASAPPNVQQPFVPPPTHAFQPSFPPPPQSPSTSNNSRAIHTPPSPGSVPEIPPQDSFFQDKEDLSGRYGDRSGETERRPSPARALTNDEETTLEKIWQPLFTSQGEPTARVSQFLRGLALHLIEDYEPKKSLVISPTKFKRFYDDVKLMEETYPWHHIFRLPHTTIGKIYRDLKCQYHLVQDQISEAPHIPALTKEGFERWMTLMIQSHPQAEFERLAIAVRDMPISNADDRKERFPKELSRRLLPKHPNSSIRQYVGAALAADGSVNLPKHTSFPPPPPSQPAQPPVSSGFPERERAPYARVDSPSRSQSSFPERERAPYGGSGSQESGAGATASGVVDGDDEWRPPTSIPIERERKPYTAKAGSGKVYEDEKNSNSSRNLKTERSNTTRTRARSTAGDSIYSNSSRNNDEASERHHHHHDRTYSKTSNRRARSPTGNGYVRSDESVGDVPSSYYNSNIYSRPEDEYYSKDRDERYQTRDRDEPRDRDRDRDRERDREREREREKERERGERELREREAFLRREREEEERRFSSRFYEGGEPLSRRSTVDNTNYGSYGSNQYPPPPLGSGERRYG